MFILELKVFFYFFQKLVPRIIVLELQALKRLPIKLEETLESKITFDLHVLIFLN